MVFRLDRIVEPPLIASIIKRVLSDDNKTLKEYKIYIVEQKENLYIMRYKHNEFDYINNIMKQVAKKLGCNYEALGRSGTIRSARDKFVIGL